MFKYQKIGEMDSEYPFLFCPKSDFWMEIPDDKVNSLRSEIGSFGTNFFTLQYPRDFLQRLQPEHHRQLEPR